MRTEFVQIGNEAFNVASVDYVNFSRREQSVRIDYASTKTAYLKGPAALAFKEWWAKRAHVYCLETEWFEEKQHEGTTDPAEVCTPDCLYYNER